MTDKEWADYWRSRCVKAEALLTTCQAVAEAHTLDKLYDQIAEHFKALSRGNDAAGGEQK